METPYIIFLWQCLHLFGASLVAILEAICTVFLNDMFYPYILKHNLLGALYADKISVCLEYILLDICMYLRSLFHTY